MRLALAAFWLVVAAGVYFGPIRPTEGISATPAALLAVALAGWNLSRWYAIRSSADVIPPSRLYRQGAERVEEYRSEFDFTDRNRPN